MTISNFDKFLAADLEWSRLDALCSQHNEVRNEQAVALSRAEGEYEKWKCCEGALECFNMDVNDSGDLAFTGLNDELVGEYLADGEAMFERMKRAALVKAGQHAELWIQACEDYEHASSELQKRRHELYAMYRDLEKQQASSREAE